MKKMIALILLLLVLPMQTMAAENVQSMVDALPTAEEFRAMDSEAQLDAYDRTQAAYDAYMALSEEEKAALPEAEEVFETLFAHYNTLVAPAETEPAEEESSMASNVVSTALAALVGILLAQKLVTKKKKYLST